MNRRVELQPTAYRDIERQYGRLEKLVREGEVRQGYPEDWYEEVEEATVPPRIASWEARKSSLKIACIA